MDALTTARRILIGRKREDLARPLARARLSLVEADSRNVSFGPSWLVAVLHFSVDDYVVYTAFTERDQQQICETLLEALRSPENDVEFAGVKVYVDDDNPHDPKSGFEDLVQEIELQKGLMIDVSTGGQRIQTVNEQYVGRRDSIRAALRERGLRDPNPYQDLWAWYGKWSSGDLPTYQSRRQYIAELYSPLLERLKQGTQPGTSVVSDEPTGWTRVDRNVDALRNRLATASNEEEFQTVGLLCRETLISLAQVVYDATQHPPTDDVKPSKTDAKRMLEAYFAAKLAGSADKEARDYAKAAVDLSNKVVHRRTATFRDAAACAEATTGVVNLAAIVSGRRDPDADF